MEEPNLVTSSLSSHATIEETKVRIEIYRLEHEDNWQLEAIDQEGTSVVWEETFSDDNEALNLALKDLQKEGLSMFRETGNVVQFPKN